MKVYTNIQEKAKSPIKIAPATSSDRKEVSIRKLKKPVRKFSTIAEVDENLEEGEEELPAEQPQGRRVSRMKSMLRSQSPGSGTRIASSDQMQNIQEEDESLYEDAGLPPIPLEQMTTEQREHFKRASILRRIIQEENDDLLEDEEEIRRKAIPLILGECPFSFTASQQLSISTSFDDSQNTVF
jgi:hypothetical protein